MKSEERGLQTEIKNIIVNELRAVEKRLATQIDGVEKRLDAKIDSKINGLEKRFEAKLDIAVLSFKDYVDSRWNQTDIISEGRFKKMENYFEQLVVLYNTQDKKFNKVFDKLGDHEDRIKLLESKN